METSLAQEIFAKLTSARQVLLVMHRRPDPDSMGAAVSMGAFLKAHHVLHAYYCSTPLPDEAAFFGIDPGQILSEPALKLSGLNQFDLVCTFDAGDLKHAGMGDQKWVRPFLIVFDHHATNANFGNLNVVEVTCASTTELLHDFFKLVRFPLTARIAAWLLAGLLVDTDHFFNPATTSRALKTAAELISLGVSLTQLRQLLFERREVGSLRLIGEILTRLKRSEQYGIAVTYLTEADIERYRLNFEEVEGVSNILNVVNDAKAMLLLKATDGIIRGSFRTTREEINVGKLAEQLGGGGHRKAAGFAIKGALQIEGERVKIV